MLTSPRLLASSTFALLLTGAAACLAQTPPAPPAGIAIPPAPAAALPTVNGVAITERDVSAALAELSEAIEGVPEATRRTQLIDYLVTLKVVAAQARKEKQGEGPDFEARSRFIIDKMLTESYLRSAVAKSVTDEAVAAFYKDQVAASPSEVEVHARHILLSTEEDAKAVVAELKAGKDFAELAKEKSQDPGSKGEGGDLGFFPKDRMVPEFAEVAFALDPGKWTETPVKTQFGYHVIKVEERRQTPTPPLAEVDGQIRTYLARKTQAELVQKLREGAQIEKK
ncbi:peptidylprolyl isomerase [Candidatus Raskinella chloraquaticus]|uniref:Parvulin-like PPIase n=1 Tax=Candidatus Raskinella chloraquaticus TaxID=1951219 RepID=A0A1W9HZJ5_9HYPH|nr:MAG: hypothetical protein A4S15_07385 [Proteobacteria bacterium SG_bin8]